MAGASSDAKLMPKRKLGLVMCVALVVGNMIGSGVFLLPASLAPLGWNSVYGWLVDDRRLALRGRGAHAAGARTGGQLRALSPIRPPRSGRASASSSPGATGSRSGSPMRRSPSPSSAISRSSGRAWPRRASRRRPPIGVLWLLTLVNCLGVRTAGGVQVVTTLLKLVPLAGAIADRAAGSSAADRRRVAAYDSVPISAAGIGAAATLALFAMLGFESAMAAGDRAENPERTVPRATLIGVLIAGLIYLLACSAVTLMLPVAELEASNAPFATFFATLVDPALGPGRGRLRRHRRARRDQRLRPAAGRDAARAGAGRPAARLDRPAQPQRDPVPDPHRLDRAREPGRARQLFARARRSVPVHGAGDDLGVDHLLPRLRRWRASSWRARAGSRASPASSPSRWRPSLIPPGPFTAPGSRPACGASP